MRGSGLFVGFYQRPTRNITAVICILIFHLPFFSGCGHEPIETTGRQQIENDLKHSETACGEIANGNPEKPSENDKLPKILSEEEAKNALKNLIENSDDEGLKVLAKQLNECSDIEPVYDEDLYDDDEIYKKSQDEIQMMSLEEIKDYDEEYKYRIEQQKQWNDDVKKCQFVFVYSSLCNLSKATFKTTVFLAGGSAIQVFEGVFIEENNEWKAIIKNKSFGDSAGNRN